MSISRTDISLFNETKQLHQLMDNSYRTEVTSFKEVFQKNTQRKIDGCIKEIAPASNNQLIYIINNIKADMNMKLIQALSMERSNELDLPLSAPIMDRLNVPQTHAQSNTSNKWHITLNNDISDENPNLDKIITQAAMTYGLEAALIKSVIKVESNFNSSSTSPKGAMGLMQLMPETARELGVKNPYDPVENVFAGTRYLKMLLRRYDGNVPLSLAAYNWGVGNIERRSEQMPAETRQYVNRVTKYYEMTKA